MRIEDIKASKGIPPLESPEEYSGHLGIPQQPTVPPMPKKVDDNSKIVKELHSIAIELKTLNSILKRLK